MSAPRVLQVTKLYPPWIGGVERAVQMMSEGLSRRHGVDVEVLACQARGRGMGATVGGVRVTRVGSLGMVLGMPVSPHFPLVYGALSRRVDLLHIHMPFPLAAWSHAALGDNGKGLIVHYHSDIVRQKRLAWMYTFFLRRLLQRADLIIVTSPALLANSPHLAPFRRKCRIIPYAVDQAAGSPGPIHVAALRTRLGVRDGGRVVLFVGRLVYYKGVEYLVDAMCSVDATLVIVGDGPCRRALQKRAVEKGGERKVLFCPTVSDQELRGYYSLADVFVLPSVEPTEAFGLVQLEAMAHGLPVVNTDLPTGVPWVSPSGETGLTVPPRDSTALARAINTILGNRHLSAKFAAQGKARVKEFSVEKMLGDICDVYGDVLAAQPRADRLTRRAG